LNPSIDGGSIQYITLGTAPSREFVVQFTAVAHYPRNYPITMQYKLFEGDNSIELHYQTVSVNGKAQTIGIQKGDGSSANQVFRDAVTSFPSNWAVKFTPPVIFTTGTLTTSAPETHHSTTSADTTGSTSEETTTTGKGDGIHLAPAGAIVYLSFAALFLQLMVL
jgi:hypothetical protein